MRSYRDYFRVLDEIRNSRGITVSDLCDGIISERTYYRHMISDQNIRFDIFNRLADRLQIQPYEIIQYSTFVRDGDPGITRFMYRVQVHHYDDILEIYNGILPYQEGKDGLSLLLKAYIKKYEYLIGKIDQKKYRSYLREIEFEMRRFVLPDINVYTFRTLYLMEFGGDSQISVVDTAECLANSDPSIGVLFLVFSFDNLFRMILGTDLITRDLYQKMFDKMGQLIQFFPHKFFHTRYILYYCYGAKLDKDEKEVQDNLYRYLLSNVLLLGKDDYDRECKIVEDLFGIDSKNYLKSHVKELMMQNHSK